MKYKPLDKVRIKNLDWYNKNKDEDCDVSCGEYDFVEGMKKFCSETLTISEDVDDGYLMLEDYHGYVWTDEMIEGLVEPIDCKKCGLTRNSTRCLFMDNCPHNQPKNTIEIPKGWVLKDENDNIINATKIVLEKKKKEYPKTYEECWYELKHDINHDKVEGYKSDILSALQKLLICRDAYWKIAGEEMGLGKPWEPDWDNVSDKYCIYFVSGNAWSKECQTRQCLFAFPTPEMRDAFKENFDPDIEFCKELL